MVGASHKSRSLVESCRFSVGTTPRLSGEDFKTQNGKNNVRAKNRSGTAEYIAETRTAG